MYEHTQQLIPLFCARSRQEFNGHMSANVIKKLDGNEAALANVASNGRFTVKGFCIPCEKEVNFKVDMRAGGREENGLFFPNWRERLICHSCRMSNRQRLIATLVMQQLKACSTGQDVYLMEQITPLYKWVSNKFRNHTIVGSEYFGAKYQGGKIVGFLDYQAPLKLRNLPNTIRQNLILIDAMLEMGGIRHEDITRLSFSDASLDLIVSNDVFEHVPDPLATFRECARVLRPGGMILATIPFHSNRDISIVRAKLEVTDVHHLLPAMYHGNPVSADGSLVFTDFGWDMIQNLLGTGFSDVMVEVYAAAEYGHMGGGQIIFRIIK